MNDLSMLLAASGGDTVKLFDVSVVSGDPCTLSYTPSSGFQVNSVKWNHTNGKKISLWRKNGQSLGTIPLAGSEGGDEPLWMTAKIECSSQCNCKAAKTTELWIGS